MPPRKLNMTLKRFIIFVFLTLDIGLFVQPYPFDVLESVLMIRRQIFHCLEIVDQSKWVDEEKMMYASTNTEVFLHDGARWGWSLSANIGLRRIYYFISSDLQCWIVFILGLICFIVFVFLVFNIEFTFWWCLLQKRVRGLYFHYQNRSG